MIPEKCAPTDVIVVGAGVVMLAMAPLDARAGNSAFTGAAFRFIFDGGDDLLRLAPDIKDLDFGSCVRDLSGGGTRCC